MKAGSATSQEPRTQSEILNGTFASNEPLAAAARQRVNDGAKQGWHPNTELSVDLITFLHHDRRMATGKGYLGVLRRDEDACIDEFRSRDAHFTFFEASSQKVYKRNPHVFVGQHITVTRRPDGTLRLNFRPLPSTKGFRVERYALDVYNEICVALEGLVEEVK